MVIMVLCCLVLLGLPPVVHADEHNISPAAAHYELTLLTGYGITHRGFGDTRTQVQTWDAIARLSWPLSTELGLGSWYQGRHLLLVELPYHLALDQHGRSMVGGYLLGSWQFTALRGLTPYLFAGGGPLYVDLGLTTMGSRLDFTYQGGVGLQLPLGTATRLNLEYRYHHISNAGTAAPNEPLNSSKFLVGVSWLR